MAKDEAPLSWKEALLAVIPGLLATLGLIRNDYSIWMVGGLVALVIYLGLAYWGNDKKFPDWSLLGLGMLTASVLVMLASIVGGLIAILAGTAAQTVVLIFLLFTFVILLGSHLRYNRMPLSAWGLFILVILCQLAVRIKYFVEFGLSWSVVGQWVSISLYAATIGLLLPVMLGILLSGRYGWMTILFVIGMVYGSFYLLIDVNDKVSDQLGGTGSLVIYQTMIPFLFTVLAPLYYLRARASPSRIGGLLALVGCAVLLNLLVVGFSYEELPPVIWVSFMPYTLSILLSLRLAYLLQEEKQPRPDQLEGALTSPNAGPR